MNYFKGDNIKLQVKNLSKIFGDNPSEAIKLLKNGANKKEIYKQTGHTVGVYNSSFSVNEGEIFVIMGLSGSGKSTLIRLLNRLIEPTLGDVFINDKNITKLNKKELREIRRKEISMVFQSFALMPHMSVLENVTFGLELSNTPKKEAKKAALKAIEQVGLSLHVDAYPDELSGGMQQRVGLARAFANNPEILLMDEAFSALDPLIRNEMQDELLKLQEAEKRTIIFISHDLDEAMKLGDRVAIMESGSIVQIGTPEEILKNPADEYVRSFFQKVNVGEIFKVKDVCNKNHPKIIKKDTTSIITTLQFLKTKDSDFAYVTSADNTYKGIVSIESLQNAQKNQGSFEDSYLPNLPTLNQEESLNSILKELASAPCPLAVVDEFCKYQGVVTKAALLNALDFNGDNNE